jgi:hypothetical protein
VLHLGVQPDTVVQPSYRTITEFTATAGQTTFSPASYTVGYIDVYRNGVKLGTADFTATNGTSVVLANACAAGDYVRFEGFLITSFNNAIANTNGAVGDSLIASLSASKLTGSQTLPSSVLPTGSVVQVVSNTTTTYTSIASTSLTDVTNLTASITPKFATSKILVVLSVNYNIRRSTNDFISGNFGIFRGATQIWTGERTTLLKGGTSVGGDVISGSQASLITLDSPSTTSSTTYKLQACVNTTANSGNINFNDFASSSSSSSITLMEIAA